MALCILLLTFSSLYCKINAITQQGRVGLWSDSECNSKSGDTSNFGEQDPIALNFTLLPDVCGVPSATVHSYRVLQNATCANGTTAMFDFYNSSNCTADPTDEDPNPGLAKRMRDRRQVNSNLDGECLALIAFNSLAFICEGVAPRDFKVNSLSTSTSSSTIPSASSALISTSFSNHSSKVTSSSATNSTTIPFAAVTSATIPTARSSPTISKPGSKSGLSAGASAGVGVGAAFGVLAIATMLFVFFRRYRLVKIKDGNERSVPGPVNPAMTSPLDRGTAHGAGQPSVHEAGSGQLYEIGGVAVDPVHEAGTNNEIREVPNPRVNLGS